MNRNVAIIAGIAGGILAGYLVARSRLSARPEATTVVVDREAPLSAAMADVADKCRSTNFVETKSSVPMKLDAAGRVVVRIIPAQNSSKYKLSQLAKGRIIAKVRNEGDGDWPQMALFGREEACWYVWAEGDNERLQSKFVRLNGTGEAPDDWFEIQFHPKDHPVDSSAWNPRFTAAMPDMASPFQLASFVPQDSTRSGNTGWTTCLVNGCCRSRQ